MHTDQDLEPFAGHFLLYEITQLVGTAELLSGKISIILPLNVAEPLNNALLEAFLIHLRSLDDFFGAVRSGKNKRDVLATDFLHTWAPSPILDETVRQAVNAQLAHLSIDRVPGTQHPWPVLRLADEAITKLGAFLEALDHDDVDESRSKKWADALRPTYDWAQNKILYLEEYSSEQFHT